MAFSMKVANMEDLKFSLLTDNIIDIFCGIMLDQQPFGSVQGAN